MKEKIIGVFQVLFSISVLNFLLSYTFFLGHSIYYWQWNPTKEIYPLVSYVVVCALAIPTLDRDREPDEPSLLIGLPIMYIALFKIAPFIFGG